MIKAIAKIADGPNYMYREELRFQYLDKSIIVESYVDDVLDYKKTYLFANNIIEYSISKIDEGASTWRVEYAYNSDNQLSKYTSHASYSLTGYVVDMSYTNDNLTSLTAKNIKLFNGDLLGYNKAFSATYNTNEKRLPYIEFNTSVFDEWFMVDLDEAVLYEQGYFGKKIKN